MTTAALPSSEAVLEPARVDRTVGGAVVFVTQKDGSSAHFKSPKLYIKSDAGIFAYRGEDFDALGLKHGQPVKIRKLAGSPDALIVDVNEKSSFLKRLFRL